MEKICFHSGFAVSIFSLVYLSKSLPTIAQTPPEELPSRETIQQTIPPNTRPIPATSPVDEKKKPKISVPDGISSSQCQFSTDELNRDYGDRSLDARTWVEEFLVHGKDMRI